jgi:hypothetical protein
MAPARTTTGSPTEAISHRGRPCGAQVSQLACLLMRHDGADRPRPASPVCQCGGAKVFQAIGRRPVMHGTIGTVNDCGIHFYHRLGEKHSVRRIFAAIGFFLLTFGSGSIGMGLAIAPSDVFSRTSGSTLRTRRTLLLATMTATWKSTCEAPVADGLRWVKRAPLRKKTASANPTSIRLGSFDHVPSSAESESRGVRFRPIDPTNAQGALFPRLASCFPGSVRLSASDRAPRTLRGRKPYALGSPCSEIPSWFSQSLAASSCS